jgi:long-chain acyl-CoA synthetase
MCCSSCRGGRRHALTIDEHNLGILMIVDVEKLTLKHILQRSFSLYAKLPCLAFYDEKPITYAELQTQVEALSAKLLSLGVERGDCVGLLGDNSPNWAKAYLAITTMASVAVPILPGFPDNDVRHIIRHAGCKAIFIGEKYRHKLEEFKAFPIIVLSLETLAVDDAEKSHAPFYSKLLHKKAKQAPADLPEPGEEDLAAIIYTSGTTGNSKGVMLSQRNLAFDIVHGVERFPIGRADRFLSILPLSHAFETTGGLLCPLAVGVSIYYLKGMPTPQKLLSATEIVKPTGILTVPLVVDKIFRKRILPKMRRKFIQELYHRPFFRKRLHKLAGKSLVKSLGGSLRFFMFGGASVNLDVEMFLREAGISYSSGYGMTETSPIMTINPFGAVKVGSCGKPIPGIEMKINQPNPETGIGEILVRGGIVMQGYYKNPAATQDAFTSDHWLKTGDLGYFDSEGYLFIKGRSKNVIIGASGENIYPEIVEQLLQQSPFIMECVVYSQRGRLLAKANLDSDVLDQEMTKRGLDSSQSGAFITEVLEEVRKSVNQQLPSFSYLQQIIEHPEPFEKTPTNKVKRYLYIPE